MEPTIATATVTVTVTVTVTSPSNGPHVPKHKTVPDIITSICEIMEAVGRRTGAPHSGDYTCTLIALIRRLREKMVPETRCVPNIKAWDVRFSDMLCHLFINSTPRPCWKRLIREIVVEEFQNAAPYDGLDGCITFATRQTQELLNIVTAPGKEKEIIDFCAEGAAMHDNPVIDARWRKFLTKGCFVHFTSVVPAGWTLLHHAAYGGSPGSVLSCLRLGIGLDSVDWSGMTPLHVACTMGRPEAIKCLIQNGANPLVCNFLGVSPLQTFLESLNRCCWREKLASQSLVSCITNLTLNNGDIVWRYLDNIQLPSTNLPHPVLERNPFVQLIAACADDQYLLSSVLSYVGGTKSEPFFDVNAIRFCLLESVRKRRFNALALLFDHFGKLVCPIISDREDMAPTVAPGTTGFICLLLATALIDSQLTSAIFLISKASMFLCQFFSSTCSLPVEAEEVDGIDMSLFSCSNLVMSAVLQGNSNILMRVLQSPLIISDDLLLAPLDTIFRLEEVDEKAIKKVWKSLSIYCEPFRLIK
jgi:hypothetical protein